MKNTNFLIILLAAVLVISCKDEKSAEMVVEETPKDLFKVGLDLVIKQDDSLQLYYKEGTNDDWAFNKVVTQVVKGNESVQEIIFDLPEDVLPTEIRLDFGTNEKQEAIEIKKFRMNYLDKTFVANDTMFYQYFIPNEQIDYDRAKAIAKPIYKQGSAYDPIFIPREVLAIEIDKLIK